MKKFILLWLVSLIAVSNLQAVWDKGNDLVIKMRENDRAQNGGKNIDYSTANAYIYYISGVVDTMIDASFICIPEGVNNGQIFAIVTKYIKNNPENWNKSASHLVIQPILDAFPCAQEKK